MSSSGESERVLWPVIEPWRWLLRAAAVSALLLGWLGAQQPRLDVGVMLSPSLWGRAGGLTSLACTIGSFLGRRRRRPATARDAWLKPLRTLVMTLAAAAVALACLPFVLWGALFDDPVIRVGDPSPGGCQAYVSYGPQMFARGTMGYPYVRQPDDARLHDAAGWWSTSQEGFDPRGRATVRWEGRHGVITISTREGRETLDVTCSR